MNTNKTFLNEPEIKINCSAVNARDNWFETEHTRIQAMTRETVKILGSVRNGNKVAIYDCHEKRTFAYQKED